MPFQASIIMNSNDHVVRMIMKEHAMLLIPD